MPFSSAAFKGNKDRPTKSHHNQQSGAENIQRTSVPPSSNKPSKDKAPAKPFDFRIPLAPIQSGQPSNTPTQPPSIRPHTPDVLSLQVESAQSETDLPLANASQRPLTTNGFTRFKAGDGKRKHPNIWGPIPKAARTHVRRLLHDSYTDIVTNNQIHQGTAASNTLTSLVKSIDVHMTRTLVPTTLAPTILDYRDMDARLQQVNDKITDLAREQSELDVRFYIDSLQLIHGRLLLIREGEDPDAPFDRHNSDLSRHSLLLTWTDANGHQPLASLKTAMQQPQPNVNIYGDYLLKYPTALAAADL
ncbi:hypothetical protein DM01DRAFT_310594 [Hesseltinella vesiculosa]|uniref:Uncharacterized protein n=1 Tax=Hesseltinella vesiculosa TaxID=101127 RepID=A0A1X2GPS2_9FUNG|nr:hypothetical protein DM01DRAFT_310594 [Hesseltinella vesiculosa]